MLYIIAARPHKVRPIYAFSGRNSVPENAPLNLLARRCKALSPCEHKKRQRVAVVVVGSGEWHYEPVLFSKTDNHPQCFDGDGFTKIR